MTQSSTGLSIVFNSSVYLKHTKEQTKLQTAKEFKSTVQNKIYIWKEAKECRKYILVNIIPTVKYSKNYYFL